MLGGLDGGGVAIIFIKSSETGMTLQIWFALVMFCSFSALTPRTEWCIIEGCALTKYGSIDVDVRFG